MKTLKDLKSLHLSVVSHLVQVVASLVSSRTALLFSVKLMKIGMLKETVRPFFLSFYVFKRLICLPIQET